MTHWISINDDYTIPQNLPLHVRGTRNNTVQVDVAFWNGTYWRAHSKSIYWPNEIGFKVTHWAYYKLEQKQTA
jgi:hypothetical protein